MGNAACELQLVRFRREASRRTIVLDLPLGVRFDIPLVNAEFTKEILYTLTNFRLGHIADESIRSTVFSDHVFKGTWKFAFLRHATHVDMVTTTTQEKCKPSPCCAIRDNWNGRQSFIMTMNVIPRNRRPMGINDTRSINSNTLVELSSSLKGGLDSSCWDTEEVAAKTFVVRCRRRRWNSIDGRSRSIEAANR